MNDEHDNAKDDKAMLERHQARRVPWQIPAKDEQLCRYCWRPVYLAFAGTGPPADPANSEWRLVYVEYPETQYCDARSTGADLSTLPHEPVGGDFSPAELATLIGTAAMAVTPPGDISAVRDTSISWDYAMVRLITRAAGLADDAEDYVYAAVIRRACEDRGPEFRAGAYSAGLTDPPASWGPRHIGISRIAHAVRKRDRGFGRVLNMGDAERREQTWVEAGRTGHPFTEPGEVYCRVCGCKEDGIQHDARYPRTGDLVP